MEELKQIFEDYSEDLIRYAIWMETKRREEAGKSIEELHELFITSNLS